MAIATSDLLSLAGQLAKESYECGWRSAISRSYYATYHHARHWETANNINGVNSGHAGGEHQQLINRLRNPDPTLDAAVKQKSKMLAAHVELQRNRRVMADYNLADDVFPADAATQVAQAGAVLLNY